MRAFMVLFFLLFCLQTCAAADTGFYDYINKDEFVYEWKKIDEKKIVGGRVYDLRLNSQVWQNLIWQHRVQIFYPEKIRNDGFCTLISLGGERDEKVDALGMMMAESCGTPVIILWNIPNQPLFEGKREDELVAYTWLKYMETGDESWPLQFPMVKSVIKCMDAVQEFFSSEGLPSADGFIVGGASKRGWTSWLTGASRDSRVKGIIPVVIDTLNLKAQLPYHIEVYGEPSEKIRDYTEAGILDRFDTPKGQSLIELVDPYSYREEITVPKLIINATNDRYWTLDALNFYWDDLKGDKWLLYVPNCRHHVEDLFRVLSTSAAFIDMVAGNKKWPHISWKYSKTQEGYELFIKSDMEVKTVTIYKAHSSTKDFRDSVWTSDIIREREDDGSVKLCLDKPREGFNACFCELCYEVNEKVFTLSTQIKIIGNH